MEKNTACGCDTISKNNNNIIPSEEGETTITNTIDRKRKMEAKSAAAIGTATTTATTATATTATTTTTTTTTESKQQQRPRQGLVKPPPKFTVTYSRLCDGGTQEMSTAVGCVREIFPDASIQTTRRQPQEEIGMPNPPVVISVAEVVSMMAIGGDMETQTEPTRAVAVPAISSGSASTSNNSNFNSVLWSSKQKNLYQKYPKKRRRSMKDIRKTLGAFKLSRTTPTEPTTRATPATQAIPTTTTRAPNEISAEFSTEPSSEPATAATATTATEKDEINIATSCP